MSLSTVTVGIAGQVGLCSRFGADEDHGGRTARASHSTLVSTDSRRRCIIEVVLDLIKEAMLKEVAKGSKGFLIDGYPREVAQGDQFEAEVNL